MINALDFLIFFDPFGDCARYLNCSLLKCRPVKSVTHDFGITFYLVVMLL